MATRNSQTGAGNVNGWRGASPSSVTPGAATPSTVVGVQGTADKAAVGQPLNARVNTPLASGSATSKTFGYSPLQSGWTAAGLSPKMTTQSQPLGGASRLSSLQGSLGSTYSKVMANPLAGPGGQTPGASDLPAWLKEQMKQLEDAQNNLVDREKALQKNMGRGGVAMSIDPLAQIKARLLTAELQNQFNKKQQIDYLVGRANSGSIYSGAVADQWMQNRTMSPMVTSGGANDNLFGGASTMLPWGNNLNPAAPTVLSYNRSAAGAAPGVMPASEYQPPGWYSGMAPSYATSIKSTQVPMPLPGGVEIGSLNALNSPITTHYVPPNLIW